MKRWIEEYQRLNDLSRLISVCGYVAVVALIIRELFAVYVDVSLYEQPTLPNHIWWEVFSEIGVAVVIIVVLTVRTWHLLRNGYSPFSFATSVVVTGLFIGYAFLTPPSSADSVCDNAGRCFGIYSLERQDWVDLAAILYFPGALLRSASTFVVSFFTARSRFE
jgi:hypothetical protein